MQNKYVGDVGDFGKYTMLRTLFRESPLKLGINWCLVERDDPYNDGKFLKYLNLDPRNPSPALEREFKPCDEKLYRTLQYIVASKNRSVLEIENSKILGEDTIFFSGKLEEGKRVEWHKSSLKALKKADIVFMDPDIGLEVSSCPKSRMNHIRYVYFDELADYYNRGQSLIIYNHRDHNIENVPLQRFQPMQKAVKKEIGKLFLLRYSRFAVRDFFFVLQPEHVKMIEQEVNAILDYPDLSRLFRMV